MATYARHTIAGDYVLARTGVSWSVNISQGDAVVQRLDEGARESSAREAVMRLARADATDAWETAGDEYRLIGGYRSGR
jgi:hypothetical protein